MGLQPVSQSWFHADIGWWFPEDDGTSKAAIRTLTSEVEADSKAHGDYVPYLFMNSAGSGQKVIEHYGCDNVKKLKSVQKMYDPGAVFQKLVPGGFKLP